MLTRTRIEAEGATVEECQADVFALYDAIIQATIPYHVKVETQLVDEHYELDSKNEDPFRPRWYKGRATLIFPTLEGVAHPIGADTVGPRTAYLHRLERHQIEQEMEAVARQVAGDQNVPEGQTTVDEMQRLADEDEAREAAQAADQHDQDERLSAAQGGDPED